MLFDFLFRPARSLSRRPRRFVPRLTALEDRTVPSTITVTNLLDDGSTGSLRWAVGLADASPDSDVIRFKNGLDGTIALGSELSITQDMTIDGPGAARITVSGNHSTRIFDVSGSSTQVHIDGLTLADGKVTGASITGAFGGVTLGGAILNNGASLALEGVVLSGNQTLDVGGANSSAGGAIANVFGAHLTVSNSLFTGNSAVGDTTTGAGALLNDVGSTALVSDTTFSGNKTTGGGGVGVFGGATGNYDGSTLTVTGCLFENNLAQGADGGGGGYGGAHGDARLRLLRREARPRRSSKAAPSPTIGPSPGWAPSARRSAARWTTSARS